MTRFTRSGHWRSSPNGGSHWVSSHSVDRDTWDGHGPLPDLLLNHPALQGSRLYGRNQLVAPKSLNECFMEPNATCPVCGALVYYYQNAFGSKVYFDDVGPPWPKHPCTDNPEISTGNAKRTKTELAEPRRREQWAINALLEYFTKVGATNGNLNDGTSELTKRWLIGRITQIERMPASSRFVLEIAHGERQQVRRCISAPLPNCVVNGTPVYVSGKIFSVFDLSAMNALQVHFEIAKQ